MSEKISWNEYIRRVVGVVLALLAVTAASFIWRIPRDHHLELVVAVYWASNILMLVGGFVIFRRVVRRGYERKRRLTFSPFFLQLLIWGLFFAFPCIYNPYNWAWSSPGKDQIMLVQLVIGWGSVGIGLLRLIIAIVWLGLSRSIGRESGKLERSGPYRTSRNPQFMGGALLVSGYVVLWPSGYALGWLLLFAILMHMMVLTEEEHLQRVYGEEYKQYCKQVPRYVGFLRRIR